MSEASAKALLHFLMIKTDTKWIELPAELIREIESSESRVEVYFDPSKRSHVAQRYSLKLPDIGRDRKR